jgi:initiation factor 1A
MPPGRNQRGGKGYKKGKKKPAEQDGELEFPVGKFTRADGVWQDYGRVLRLLGDRRVLCFCNDGNERVAKIRGALCKGPKKKIIEKGDIVLLSFRDFMGRIHVSGTSMEGLGMKQADDAPVTGMALTTGTGRKEIADLLEREGLNFGMRFEDTGDGVRVSDWGTPPKEAVAAAPDDVNEE